MPSRICQCQGVKFSWQCSFPEMVPKILPFCGSARTSDHNKVSILPSTQPAMHHTCFCMPGFRPCEAFQLQDDVLRCAGVSGGRQSGPHSRCKV